MDWWQHDETKQGKDSIVPCPLRNHERHISDSSCHDPEVR